MDTSTEFSRPCTRPFCVEAVICANSCTSCTALSNAVISAQQRGGVIKIECQIGHPETSTVANIHHHFFTLCNFTNPTLEKKMNTSSGRRVKTR